MRSVFPVFLTEGADRGTNLERARALRSLARHSLETLSLLFYLLFSFLLFVYGLHDEPSFCSLQPNLWWLQSFYPSQTLGSDLSLLKTAFLHRLDS